MYVLRDTTYELYLAALTENRDGTQSTQLCPNPQGARRCENYAEARWLRKQLLNPFGWSIIFVAKEA